MRRAWEKERSKQRDGKEPGFRTALARAFGWDYLRCVPLVLTEVTA